MRKRFISYKQSKETKDSYNINNQRNIKDSHHKKTKDSPDLSCQRTKKIHYDKLVIVSKRFIGVKKSNDPKETKRVFLEYSFIYLNNNYKRRDNYEEKSTRTQ